MKALQAHFLKLTIDGFNPRAMSMNQRGIFNRIAPHSAALRGNETRTTIDITQLLVQVTDIAFVSDDRTTGQRAFMMILKILMEKSKRIQTIFVEAIHELLLLMHPMLWI